MTHLFSDRRAGVICHPTSLPPGTTTRFLDFMKAAGLSVWQVLPLHPPDRHRSPYNATSLFALNPDLADSGYEPDPQPAAYDEFRADNAHWLDDWVLFEHARSRLGADWQSWPEDLKRRSPEGLKSLRSDRDALEALYRQQFRAQSAWQAVRDQVSNRGILLFGDMPLYPAFNSADVWAAPDHFDLTPDFTPRTLAGVPPDYFSTTGQLWGNPIYDWARMASDDYGWWVRRLKRLLTLVDIVRLDHFRGLAAYWAVPAGSTDAKPGEWRPGPGRTLLEALETAGVGAALVAEDLGLIDEAVDRLRDDFSLPGMRVLQFAFSGDAENPHLPAKYPPHCVAYTGTHDNDTSRGWYEGLQWPIREKVDRIIGTGGPSAWRMVATVFASAANTAIAPLQDYLNLDSTHRMNTPGTEAGNWRWQLDWHSVPEDLTQRIHELAVRTGRIRN